MAPGTPFILTHAVHACRKANPGKPVEIGLLRSDTVRRMVRGLDRYDPRFGAAFRDGRWNAGFDHVAALASIACPVLLMLANVATLPDGTLDGAVSDAEAQRARALLQHGRYLKVDAEHVVNLDKPALFAETLERFLLQP